jgi:solute carrier family 25 (mitochondrial carnitine/acylcarnitine transporter), member 20/29
MAVPQLRAVHQQAETRKPLVNDSIRGFLAGAFSGFAKCTVGHPFDTIKVRMQTCAPGQFKGPLDCLLRTIRQEGIGAVYKGVTPPLVGWLAMDSVMLGSLTLYRRMLKDSVPHNSLLHREDSGGVALRSFGHGIAGMMAGSTVCIIATPVEHIKARLQVQYAANKADRLYHGPIDCVKKIFSAHGIRGLWLGFPATLVFRSFFFFWWGSYDLFSRFLHKNSSLSTPAINFWAGGASAQVFWITAYPSDVVKQRIMTDPLGGRLNDGVRRFPRWINAAQAVYKEFGWRGYWRGFVPCFLRAFPANACALLAFESVMRGLS